MKRFSLSWLAAATFVLLAAGQSFAAPWYVARYNGGGTSTNDTNNIMAGSAPVASGSYNLIDFTDPQNQGGPSNFALDNPILGNTGGDDNDYAMYASGILNVTTTGTYIFRSSADDGSRITLNGRNIVSTDASCCTNADSVGITLTAGSKHTITYSFKEGGGGSHGELAVSSDGGTTFNLLGQGTDGAFTAAPGLVVDQGFSAPAFTPGPLTVAGPNGLNGSYYNTTGSGFTATQNGGGSGADAFLATNPTPTGTFISTNPLYNTGATTVGAHLGVDGASLTAGFGDSTDDSMFTLNGYLQILPGDDFDPSQPGIQVSFRLDTDDNSRMTIGDFVILENDGSHGMGHFASNNTDLLAAGTGDNAIGTQVVTFNTAGYYDFEVFYKNGGGGLGLQLFSSIGGGGPQFPLGFIPADRFFQSVSIVPEPASIALWAVIGALLFGWARRRKAKK